MADGHATEGPLRDMLDRLALRQTAETYAIGADRRDKAMWRNVLAQDCVIEGPGFTTTGREECLSSLDGLDQMFRATRHCVHQQRVSIEGNHAFGETYCTAEHLLPDRDAVLVWAIRYQDEWQREQAGAAREWRFTRRKLVLDWTETRPATPVGQMEEMQR
ncbi:nuclear transport factor 2 family protein [Novosphingobium sp. BL-8H]|uniref:nuclear transport factor 2 family protein n=1 Tax=Novosphingobium sp. BL-8H TaxID=3127640 RepID=UPI00375716CE